MNVLNILSDKALLMSKTIEHLSARSIRGKLSSYLLEEFRQRGDGSFKLGLKRNELADYLGIPRPSLSREMANMKRDGFIDYEGLWVKINDVVQLEQLIV